MPYKESTIKKYRWRIGEVAEMAKIEPHSIRFYEKHFHWLKPDYSGKHRGKISRSYTLDGVNNVLEVLYLLSYGVAIRGIKKAHDDNYYADLLEFFGYLRYDPETWTEQNKKEHDTNRKD